MDEDQIEIIFQEVISKKPKNEQTDYNIIEGLIKYFGSSVAEASWDDIRKTVNDFLDRRHSLYLKPRFTFSENGTATYKIYGKGLYEYFVEEMVLGTDPVFANTFFHIEEEFIPSPIHVRNSILKKFKHELSLMPDVFERTQVENRIIHLNLQKSPINYTFITKDEFIQVPPQPVASTSK